MTMPLARTPAALVPRIPEVSRMHRRRIERAPASPLVILAGVVLLSLPFLVTAASPRVARAAAVDDRLLADPAARTRIIKSVQHDLLMRGAHNHIAEARARKLWERWRKRHPGSGLRARPAPETEESMLPLDQKIAAARAPRVSALATQSIPANVRCNNPAGDGA